jgi:hypothetical protein
MTIVRISEAEMLEMGLKTIGYDRLRQQRTQHLTNLKRFRASFGPLPITASQLFSGLLLAGVIMNIFIVDSILFSFLAFFYNFY